MLVPESSRATYRSGHGVSTRFHRKFREDEFTTDVPRFIHADLTWDHFLLVKEGNQWTLGGVIDFADCRTGHPGATGLSPLKTRDASPRSLDGRYRFTTVKHVLFARLVHAAQF